MSEALIQSTPLTACTEKVLWFAGRFLRVIPAETRIRIPFGINRGYRWIRGAANAPEWLGIYEYRKQHVLHSLVPPRATVCDIGANAGFYSIALSRCVGPDGRVLAFEPLPQNLRKLRAHLDLNKIDNVSVSDYALADRTGTVSFAIGDSDFTGHIDAAANGLQVQTITLDQFLAENGTVDPSFLKIDVEGAEAQVLAGARKLIARAHPTMLIAIHGVDAASGCFSVLDAAGYTITSLTGAEIKSAAEMVDEIVAQYRGRH